MVTVVMVTVAVTVKTAKEMVAVLIIARVMMKVTVTVWVVLAAFQLSLAGTGCVQGNGREVAGNQSTKITAGITDNVVYQISEKNQKMSCNNRKLKVFFTQRNHVL